MKTGSETFFGFARWTSPAFWRCIGTLAGPTGPALASFTAEKSKGTLSVATLRKFLKRFLNLCGFAEGAAMT
jgi:hypothetical protein